MTKPDDWPRLVPELIVSDIARSLAFYTALGFEVRYERPAERFAYLDREGAHLMIEQSTGRRFLAGDLESPFGRGMNLQIAVSDAAALYSAAGTLGASVYLPIEERWYGRGGGWVGSRQFIVQDPDGYLLRFAEHLGERSTQPDGLVDESSEGAPRASAD